MRKFRRFSWKDTNLRIASDCFEVITQAIVKERLLLEAYIAKHPEFSTTMAPVPLQPDAPISVKRMAAAAAVTGLGPMASVAGTLAQMGAEAALAAGATEAIVENGGDMYIASDSLITIGIYAGTSTVGDNLAFVLPPEELPLSLCSSSGTMGHSLSLGQCDLVTVIAQEAALADSVATLVCNRIKAVTDLEPVLNEAGNLTGVRGILAVKDDKIGLYGNLPQLSRNQDVQLTTKITRDQFSNFSS